MLYVELSSVDCSHVSTAMIPVLETQQNKTVSNHKHLFYFFLHQRFTSFFISVCITNRSCTWSRQARQKRKQDGGVVVRHVD